MTQDAAVERVGTRRIQGFPKQFIVNANQQQYSRQITSDKNQNRVNGSKIEWYKTNENN